MASVASFFGKFFGNTISESAAYGIGGALREPLHPLLQELTNETWKVSAAAGIGKPPDAFVLAEGVAQGQVDEGDAREWAAQQGITNHAFTALVDIANVGPALGLAYSAWRRGELTDAQFTTALKRTGLEAAWYSALHALKDNLLDPSIIANAVHRGIMRDPSLIVREPPTTAGKVEQVPPSTLDPVTEAAGSGINHERLRVEVGTTGLPPGLVQMLQLLNRGSVTADDVRRAVSQSNLRNEYMDVVLDLARQLLTPTEYVDAHLRGYITQDAMYAGTALHGMTQADTDILFESHGRPLTVHQLVTGEARGGKYGGPIDAIPAEFIAALKESSIKPLFYNLAYANRHSLPSAFVMRALTQSGVWTQAKAETRLLESGWIPEDAKEAAAAWAGGGGATADPHLAKAQTQLWSRTHSSYIGEEIDDAQATQALTTAGVDAASIPAILQLWQAEKGLIRKQLTAAQVKKAVKSAVVNPATGAPWSQADALARLLELGYDEADAETFLAS